MSDCSQYKAAQRDDARIIRATAPRRPGGQSRGTSGNACVCTGPGLLSGNPVIQPLRRPAERRPRQRESGRGAQLLQCLPGALVGGLEFEHHAEIGDRLIAATDPVVDHAAQLVGLQAARIEPDRLVQTRERRLGLPLKEIRRAALHQHMRVLRVYPQRLASLLTRLSACIAAARLHTHLIRMAAHRTVLIEAYVLTLAAFGFVLAIIAFAV